jgi:hypothetical protein
VAHWAPSAQLLKDTATLERLVGLRVARDGVTFYRAHKDE